MVNNNAVCGLDAIMVEFLYRTVQADCMVASSFTQVDICKRWPGCNDETAASKHVLQLMSVRDAGNRFLFPDDCAVVFVPLNIEIRMAVILVFVFFAQSQPAV